MHVFTYLFLSLLEQSFPVLLAERILSVEESMFSKMATVCVCVCVCIGRWKGEVGGIWSFHGNLENTI